MANNSQHARPIQMSYWILPVIFVDSAVVWGLGLEKSRRKKKRRLPGTLGMFVYSRQWFPVEHLLDAFVISLCDLRATVAMLCCTTWSWLFTNL